MPCNFSPRTTGEKLTIALVGGSVSKGMGAVSGEPSFEMWLQAWLSEVAPAAEPAAEGLEAGDDDQRPSSTVTIVNAACSGTSSNYMNMCLRVRTCGWVVSGSIGYGQMRGCPMGQCVGRFPLGRLFGISAASEEGLVARVGRTLPICWVLAFMPCVSCASALCSHH